MALDAHGSPLGVPKPVSEKKAKGKGRGGAAPRKYGDSVERNVAKMVGGQRIPSSGAIKHSNKDLTGDVGVRAEGEQQDFLKLEVKARSLVLTASGEKTFTIAKDVLDQATREAEEARQIGAVLFHFKGQRLEDGYTIVQNKHFTELTRLAALGKTLEK